MEAAYLPRPRANARVAIPVALLALLGAWCTMRLFDARNTPEMTMQQLVDGLDADNMTPSKRRVIVEAIRRQVLEGICALTGVGEDAQPALAQIREAVR